MKGIVTIYTPDSNPSATTMSVRDMIRKEYGEVTSGNFNYFAPECQVIVVTSKTGSFNHTIEGSTMTDEIRNGIMLHGTIKVLLAYTPSYSETPLLYTTEVHPMGLNIIVSGKAQTQSKAIEIMEKAVKEQPAKKKPTTPVISSEESAFSEYINSYFDIEGEYFYAPSEVSFNMFKDIIFFEGGTYIESGYDNLYVDERCLYKLREDIPYTIEYLYNRVCLDGYEGESLRNIISLREFTALISEGRGVYVNLQGDEFYLTYSDFINSLEEIVFSLSDNAEEFGYANNTLTQSEEDMLDKMMEFAKEAPEKISSYESSIEDIMDKVVPKEEVWAEETLGPIAEETPQPIESKCICDVCKARIKEQTKSVTYSEEAKPLLIAL